MKNYDERLSAASSSHRRLLLAALCTLVLSSCGKSPEQVPPSQSPPRPQVMTQQLPHEVQRAVFSYSSNSPIQFQNGQGATIERHVIHT